jgi:hypothetical protein
VIAIVVATRATVGVAVLSPTISVKRGIATSASPNPNEERTNVDRKNMIKTQIIVSDAILNKRERYLLDNPG